MSPLQSQKLLYDSDIYNASRPLLLLHTASAVSVSASYLRLCNSIVVLLIAEIQIETKDRHIGLIKVGTWYEALLVIWCGQNDFLYEHWLVDVLGPVGIEVGTRYDLQESDMHSTWGGKLDFSKTNLLAVRQYPM